MSRAAVAQNVVDLLLQDCEITFRRPPHQGNRFIKPLKNELAKDQQHQQTPNHQRPGMPIRSWLQNDAILDSFIPSQGSVVRTAAAAADLHHRQQTNRRRRRVPSTGRECIHLSDDESKEGRWRPEGEGRTGRKNRNFRFIFCENES